ncbi:MAG: hypothetical protein JXR76_01200 [Deltaproteobacteria bacterium]|nr:hypothetical protein [Deltaproteobacteria bacterium]
MKTILYITFSKRSPREFHRDASVIYRCFQPCEYWRSIGYRSYVVHHEEALSTPVDADVVVFHRPRAVGDFAPLRKRYEKCLCIADYDDCLFDESILESHPALLSGTTSLQVLKKQTLEYGSAVTVFDTFCVSTDGIRASLDRMLPGCQVAIMRNGISPFWRNLGGLTPLQKDKKIISYFSGTANHTADLVEHLDAIEKAVDDRDELEMHVYGQLKLNRPLSHRWKRLEPVAFHHLPQLIQQSWICIAPIMDNPFNRCKSAIKFLESATFGRPLITQPLPEFTRLANPGLKLVTNDWESAISDLMMPSSWDGASAAATQIAKENLVQHQMGELLPWI